MKKSLFLLPLLALGLVACGGTNSSETGSTDVESGTTTENLIETISFAGVTDKGTALNDTNVAEKLSGFSTTVTWTSASKVYLGNGTGGAKENTAGLLKFGTGGTTGAQGVLTFTVSETVASIVLNCHSFYADDNPLHPENVTNFVSANEMTPVAAPYNETATGEDVRFDLATAGTTITIKSCDSIGTSAGRIYIYSISLYR